MRFNFAENVSYVSQNKKKKEMKMFEDKEEVKKAMMDLKLFGLDGFESPDDDILESSIEMAENQIQVRISLFKNLRLIINKTHKFPNL